MENAGDLRENHKAAWTAGADPGIIGQPTELLGKWQSLGKALGTWDLGVSGRCPTELAA